MILAPQNHADKKLKGHCPIAGLQSAEPSITFAHSLWGKDLD